MNMDRFHQLRHKVNVAATKIDDELGAGRADNPPVDSNPHVRAAHEALGELGLALLALDAWGKEQEQEKLPPATTGPVGLPEEPPKPTEPGVPVVEPQAGGFVGTVYLSNAGPPENPSGRVKWRAGAGATYSLRMGSTGRFSVTAESGNVPMEIATQADFSDKEGPQSGSTPEKRVHEGETYYVRFTGGATVQVLTASIPSA